MQSINVNGTNVTNIRQNVVCFVFYYFILYAEMPNTSIISMYKVEDMLGGTKGVIRSRKSKHNTMTKIKGQQDKQIYGTENTTQKQ